MTLSEIITNYKTRSLAHSGCPMAAAAAAKKAEAAEIKKAEEAQAAAAAKLEEQKRLAAEQLLHGTQGPRLFRGDRCDETHLRLDPCGCQRLSETAV
mgnify:CR=1 FL=1